MDAACHECGSRLVKGETTREAPRRLPVASRGSGGDASKVKHTSWRCGPCGKTRAVQAEREW